MTIALTPQQQAWLETAVAEGRFASVEDGVQAAVERMMVGWEHSPIDPADDAWVLPLLEEGRASYERDGGISLEEWREHVANRRAKRSA